MVKVAYSSCKNVKIEINEKYCLFSIERQDKANAYNQTMLEFISNKMDEYESDESVRCIAFTGSGQTFCSGADLAEISARHYTNAFNLKSEELFTKIFNSSKFTIAIINGSAVAGGLELCMSCDFRISSTNANFSFPELSLGIIPAAGGIQRLIELVGAGRAKELILMGMKWNAQESYQYGLINQITVDSNLMELAFEKISNIVKFDALAYRLAKQSISHYYSNQSLKNFDKLSQSLLILSKQTLSEQK